MGNTLNHNIAEKEKAVEREDFVVMYNIRMENWAKRIIIISKRKLKKKNQVL